jgi:hypothetical protein
MASKFTRTGGTARRYIDPATGKDISRRQYDKLKKAAGTYKRVTDVVKLAEQRRKQARYNSLAAEYQAKMAAKGKAMKLGDIRKSDTFKNAVTELKRANKARNKIAKAERAGKPATKEELAKSNARLKKILEKLGRREGIPAWVPVGFSDRYRQGKLKSPANLPKAYRF